MCDKEGTPCELVEGIGGVREGVCDLLATALDAQRSVQRQSVMGLLECPRKPRIDVSPTHHDFGVTAPSVAVRETATFTISNIGDEELVIGSVSLMPALPAHFKLVSSPAGTAIPPNQIRTFIVACSPVSKGMLRCDVQIASNAVNTESPVLVSLAVTAGVPEIAVSPGSCDFGALMVGKQSTPVTVVITNPGLVQLTVQSVAFGGGSAGFKISPGKVSGTIAPAETHPQAKLEFTVTGTPAKAVESKATLLITSNADSGKPVRLNLTMKGVQPKITVKNKEWDFKNIPVGGEAASHVFIISNPGSAPLTISDISFKGDKAFSFAGDAKPAEAIQPAAQWELKIACLPTVARLCSAQLIIRSDAQNEKSPLVLKLTATGVEPAIGISSHSVSFGTLYFGESKVQTITIRNTGGGALRVSRIALDDDRHFSLELPAMDQPIEANGTCTFSVKSAPTLSGLQLAQVTIESNARGKPPMVELKASGRQPAVTLRPASTGVLYAQVPKQGQLAAAGKPDGGVYAWTIQDPAIANFTDGVNPGNVAEVNLQGLAPGTTDVTVSYTVGSAPVASATVQFHVVHVAIAQGAALALTHPNGQPATIQALTAVGTPVGGTVLFQPLVHRGGRAAAAYVNKNANTTLATSVRTVDYGRSTATVEYEFAGIKAQASIDVDVSTQSCSQVAWQPAAEGKVAHVPFGRCTHEPVDARQRPSTAVTTVAANFPHHHGDKCQHCNDAGQPVHHYVNSESTSAAVAALKELHSQITALQGHFPDTWMPNQTIPAAAQDYMASRPWLKDISAWVFKPDGWQAPCSACHATGSIRGACGACAGTGTVSNGQRRCRDCNGNGKGKQSVPCDQCNGTKFVVNIRRGKMIGVLVARDALGQIHHLRGVSGAFQGTQKVGPKFGAPNPYWARQLEDPANIPSASHAWRDFGPVDERFGKCAATHMLAQALDQKLELVSMAEMWIGATQGTRFDGQLQSSCENCRQYFAHMLCDAGADARTLPYDGSAVIPKRGFA